MSRPLVMVAEDNPSLRKMLGMVLAKSGYDVLCAGDGRQAVALAAERKPALLLLDVRMPEISGTEALRQIRALPGMGKAPAIMLSAINQREEVMAAAKAGACDYIVKSGFDINYFLGRVRTALAGDGAQEKPVQAATPEQTAQAKPATPPEPASQPASPAASSPSPSPADGSATRNAPPASADGFAACSLRDLANRPELANHAPPISSVRLAEQIKEIAGVKALPFVLPQVLSLTASQYSSAEQLVKTIEQDVALTGKVLAMANSSIYRRGRAPVTSLGQAVKNIGFGSVRQAALGLGIMELFARVQEGASIDRLGFWEHSFASGSIARLLAERAGLDESQAFVVGMLHSVGQLIYDEFFGPIYSRMLDLCGPGRAAPPDIHRRYMGLDHAQLAAAVMREWKMPAELAQPIADYRLAPAAFANKTETRRQWAGLTALADQLATCIGFGDRRACQLWHVPDEMIQPFGLTDGLLQELRDSVPIQLHELKLMMMVYMSGQKFREHRCPISDRPIVYLRVRPCQFDVFEYYLRLRHSDFTAVESPERVTDHLARLAPADGDDRPLVVINLLPGPVVSRAIEKLDTWAAEQSGDRFEGVLLAHPGQAEQLVGPLGERFRGLLGPVVAGQLDHLLGLDPQNKN